MLVNNLDLLLNWFIYRVLVLSDLNMYWIFLAESFRKQANFLGPGSTEH